MVLKPVECPVCGGTNVIKHGKSGEGKQRYLCQDQVCCGKTFIREYSDLGRLPQIKEQIGMVQTGVTLSSLPSASRC